MLHSTFILSCLTVAVSAALTDSSLEKHVDSLTLSSSFNPIKESYWTGYPHHRRTPFAVSPDGKSAYLAYLDASETDVHIQQVDPSTFTAVGTATTVSGAKEAGGLVAHNDGFALLTNEALASGTANAPADSTPVPVLYRYTSGKQSWKTYLGGPGVHEDFGLVATPDINGDLAFSEAAGMYGAYFVVTAYTGSASGHFGDSIQYVNENGTLETIQGASSSWGCSHNTGIAFEAADSVPFASLCAEDQGAIWLNTKTQSMNGVKVSNENVTNGASNEAMGGMSGSYSGLARFIDSDSYIFTWVSRGAKDLTTNDWLGAGFTHSINRTNNRNVAITQFSDKNTLVGPEATSELVADGDSQVNWITQGTADCSNAHVAAFDGINALVTWEEIAEPQCDFIAMGCKGAFTGAYYQLVNNGKKVGEPVKATDVFVAGDMVTMSDGRICWPYVAMDWKLDGPVMNAASVTKMSFACMSLDGSGSSTTSAASSAAVASSTPAASSVAQATTAPSSVGQEDASAAAPEQSESASSAAFLSSVVDPLHTSSAQADPLSSALPSFEIVSSGVPISSVAAPSSALAVPSSIAEPSETPASSTPRLSSAALTGSSAAIPTEVPLPSRPAEEGECTPQPTITITAKETVTVTAGSETLTASAEDVTDIPTGIALPTRELPPLPSFGGPRPSGAPFPSGIGGHDHHHHHHRPTGSGAWPWPTGFSGFPPRPSGGFGGPMPSDGGFETRVRPTPTGLGY